MNSSAYRITSGEGFKLSRFKPGDTGAFPSKDAAKQATEKLLERLDELQERLYAESKHALLIILQSMDTGGKDGTIEHVFGAVDPQGCSVTSFKKPTPLESAHDFLWRIHLAVPAKGMIGILNRSHYESVLIERVQKLTPKQTWQSRFDHINAFEKMLADEGTTIVKFFLHISKDEQKRRLQARLDDPQKRWKFDPSDLEQRRKWGDYMKAYEDAIRLCSSKTAPWYVVPADHKWFRNWVVADALVRTLEGLKMKYPKPAKLDGIRVK